MDNGQKSIASEAALLMTITIFVNADFSRDKTWLLVVAKKDDHDDDDDVVLFLDAFTGTSRRNPASRQKMTQHFDGATLGESCTVQMTRPTGRRGKKVRIVGGGIGLRTDPQTKGPMECFVKSRARFSYTRRTLDAHEWKAI
jgi:hypothetical protein